MSPETCRALFVHGVASADLAVVEGRYDSAIQGEPAGGRLDSLCEWLDLPRLIVLDVTHLGRCRLPPRPDPADGLLLDRVSDAGQLARLRTELEALWGIPVLGALEPLPRFRQEALGAAQGSRLPREVYHRLGDNFARYWRPASLLRVACGRGLPAGGPGRIVPVRPRRGLTVAIAYDEAFNRYFPETLELLESAGASVVDFSPLRDENLPAQADVVYIGCGRPERFAAALSENHCMKAALRSHLCAGRRIYGEGAGAAYLCELMETPGGQLKRMAGILPAVARLGPAADRLRPMELTLGRPSWLGHKGALLRGYRNPTWQLQPRGHLTSLASEPEDGYCLVGSFLTVGSLLHLNFIAHPVVFDHFFFPETPPEVLKHRPVPVWGL